MKKLILLLFIPLVSFGQEDIEKLKHRLSRKSDTEDTINEAAGGPFNYNVTRDEFDAAIMKLINPLWQRLHVGDRHRRIKYHPSLS